MISVEGHSSAVASLLAPVVERVRDAEPDVLPVTDPQLVGRVCAVPMLAAIALPPFDNSQMDGYAVSAEDLRGATPDAPVYLTIGVATAAGDPPVTHQPGMASPVMTGAAIAKGADAVVPVEATLPPRFPPLNRAGEPPQHAIIGFTGECEAGAFVRSMGEDQQPGELIVAAGQRLTPARIGALAAAGVTSVPVRRRMRVLVCTTGDELVGVDSCNVGEADITGSPLAPGRIHDANAPMLAALLGDAGAEVRVARCDDSAEALLRLIKHEAADADLVVTSGGISAGAFEVVREAFTPLGADFYDIAMQPGGPQGLGALAVPGRPLPLAALCFPGNPVSSFLSATLFLLPSLRELAGLSAEAKGEWRALSTDTTSPEHKLQLRRAVLEADGSVTPLAPGSHLLHDLATADVIAQIPEGVAFAAAGTPVFTWRIND